jgi:hypothetical protein
MEKCVCCNNKTNNFLVHKKTNMIYYICDNCINNGFYNSDIFDLITDNSDNNEIEKIDATKYTLLKHYIESSDGRKCTILNKNIHHPKDENDLSKKFLLNQENLELTGDNNIKIVRQIKDIVENECKNKLYSFGDEE